MCSYIAKHIYIVQIQKPVSIVDHQCFTIGEIDETGHLFLEAVNVVLDGFFCHHLTHICSSGRVTDHTGTAAEKCDRTVACHLKTFHQAECHKMSYMKTVCCRVKANVEGCLSVIYHFFDLVFICYLGNQASRLKFFPYCHNMFLLLLKKPGSCPS